MQDVFVLAGGQDDNLGDSALRRGMLASIRSPHRRLQVLTPRASDAYLSGLGLAADDIVHRSWDEWYSALTDLERPSLLMNAGEANPPSALRYPDRRLIAAARWVRHRGGAVLHTGVGFRNPAIRSWAFLGSKRLTVCDLVTWRDEPSRRAARRGDVVADWAFALGTPSSDWGVDRDRLVVTLRSDRDRPSPEWFQRVRDLAARSDLEIVTLAQVGRDRETATWLAQQFGARSLDHSGTDHNAMDAHVREVFGSSRFVVSDRVHALIIGATEGAIPLGSTPGSPQKVLRTLAPATLESSSGDHAAFPTNVNALAFDELGRRVSETRTTLTDLGARMRSLLDGAA